MIEFLKKLTKKKYFWEFLFSFVILSLFLFFRFYKLTTSLEFFGDVGRDLHVIILSLIEKKPLLLGPGISFLPLNQSPLYYYLLMPVFILSGYSAYTSVITINLIYISGFVLGLYSLRKNKVFMRSLLVIGFLIALHPQFIHQLRNPWNPSFAPPFILASLFALIYLRKKYTQRRALILGGSLAIALGLTVSITPVALIIFSYALFLQRKNLKNLLSLLAIFILSLLVVFSPVLLFEIRHDFFFTRRLMMPDPYLSKEPIDYWLKFTKLIEFVSGSENILLSGTSILIALTINLYLIFRKKISDLSEELTLLSILRSLQKFVNRSIKNKDQLFLIFLNLFIISAILTYSMPFVLHAHYIFGILALLLLTISFIRKKLLIVLIIILSFLWLNQAQLNKHWSPPRRTVSQLESCAQKICSTQKEPIFVTVQAWHVYHSALEYTFLLNKNGCQARNIIQNPEWPAQKMLVFVDHSQYSHGETAFEELTVFGESTQTSQIDCGEDLKVFVLGKR
jgi:hypothetical protein